MVGLLARETDYGQILDQQPRRSRGRGGRKSRSPRKLEVKV